MIKCTLWFSRSRVWTWTLAFLISSQVLLLMLVIDATLSIMGLVTPSVFPPVTPSPHKMSSSYNPGNLPWTLSKPGLLDSLPWPLSALYTSPQSVCDMIDPAWVWVLTKAQSFGGSLTVWTGICPRQSPFWCRWKPRKRKERGGLWSEDLHLPSSLSRQMLEVVFYICWYEWRGEISSCYSLFLILRP